jgi:hypothetical protein
MDRRKNLVYPFRIKSLSPPNGAMESTQGAIEVELSPVTLTDGVPSQTAVFDVCMTDRAGHTSNTVTSPGITVTN